MTIKEYIEANGDIVTGLPPYYNGIFTNEHITNINLMLKYNYRDKLMVYSTESEVADVVSFVLFENRYKYKSGNQLVSFELPSYTLQETDTTTKTNTGTQNISDSSTKRNTGTSGIVDSNTKNNTGTQGNVGTETLNNTGTQINKDTGTSEVVGHSVIGQDSITTTDPNDTTKSVLGFDGGALVANEKSANSQVKTTIANDTTSDSTDTTTNDLTSTRTDNLTAATTKSETRTDALSESNNGSSTRTDDLTETDTNTHIRTDNLTETNTNTHNTTDIALKIELMDKMVEYTENKRIRLVCEDLIAMLCVRTWNDVYYE